MFSYYSQNGHQMIFLLVLVLSQRDMHKTSTKGGTEYVSFTQLVERIQVSSNE